MMLLKEAKMFNFSAKRICLNQIKYVFTSCLEMETKNIFEKKFHI